MIDEDGVGWLVCKEDTTADAAADGPAVELVLFPLFFEGVEEAAKAVAIDALVLVAAAVLEEETVAAAGTGAATVEDAAMELDEEGMAGTFVDDGDDDHEPVLVSNLRPWAF